MASYKDLVIRLLAETRGAKQAEQSLKSLNAEVDRLTKGRYAVTAANGAYDKSIQRFASKEEAYTAVVRGQMAEVERLTQGRLRLVQAGQYGLRFIDTSTNKFVAASKAAQMLADAEIREAYATKMAAAGKVHAATAAHRLTQANLQAAEAAERLKLEEQQLHAQTGSATFAVLSLGQGLQDAGQFGMGMAQGIRAITNNVQMSVQALVLLSQSVKAQNAALGTTTTTWQAFWTAAKGPVGWLMAFSAVSALVEGLSNHFQKARKEGEAVKSVAQSLVEITSYNPQALLATTNQLYRQVELVKDLLDGAEEANRLWASQVGSSEQGSYAQQQALLKEWETLKKTYALRKEEKQLLEEVYGEQIKRIKAEEVLKRRISERAQLEAYFAGELEDISVRRLKLQRELALLQGEVSVNDTLVDIALQRHFMDMEEQRLALTERRIALERGYYRERKRIEGDGEFLRLQEEAIDLDIARGQLLDERYRALSEENRLYEAGTNLLQRQIELQDGFFAKNYLLEYAARWADVAERSQAYGIELAKMISGEGILLAISDARQGHLEQGLELWMRQVVLANEEVQSLRRGNEEWASRLELQQRRGDLESGQYRRMEQVDMEKELVGLGENLVRLDLERARLSDSNWRSKRLAVELAETENDILDRRKALDRGEFDLKWYAEWAVRVLTVDEAYRALDLTEEKIRSGEAGDLARREMLLGLLEEEQRLRTELAALKGGGAAEEAGLKQDIDLQRERVRELRLDAEADAMWSPKAEDIARLKEANDIQERLNGLREQYAAIMARNELFHDKNYQAQVAEEIRLQRMLKIEQDRLLVKQSLAALAAGGEVAPGVRPTDQFGNDLMSAEAAALNASLAGWKLKEEAVNRTREAQESYLDLIDREALANSPRWLGQLTVSAAKASETVSKVADIANVAIGGVGQNLMMLAQQGEETNKRMFNTGKAFAIANAVINTAEGATKALGQGGFFGFGMMAAVIAAGMAQIATIAAAQPGKNNLSRGGTRVGSLPSELLTASGQIVSVQKSPSFTPASAVASTSITNTAASGRVQVTGYLIGQGRDLVAVIGDEVHIQRRAGIDNPLRI